MRARGAPWLALVLIAFGVFFLLRETGAIPKDVSIGPILLIAAGALLLVLALSTRLGRGGLVVPFVLLALGIVLLLRDRGTLPEDFSVWPAVLIAVGAGLLLGGASWGLRQGRSGAVATRRIALDGAREARVQLRHGAGRLRVEVGSDPTVLLEGTFRGGVRDRVRRKADLLEVRLESEPGWGWGGRARRWDVALAPGVPVSLDVQTGASDAILDLSALTVPSLEMHTGASQSRVMLPARGHSSVRIEAGAASVEAQVPEGVAARIRFRGGMATRNIDEARFPRAGDEFRSPDYDTAENRADIDIQGGAGSFTVR